MQENFLLFFMYGEKNVTEKDYIDYILVEFELVFNIYLVCITYLIFMNNYFFYNRIFNFLSLSILTILIIVFILLKHISETSREKFENDLIELGKINNSFLFKSHIALSFLYILSSSSYNIRVKERILSLMSEIIKEGIVKREDKGDSMMVDLLCSAEDIEEERKGRFDIKKL